MATLRTCGATTGSIIAATISAQCSQALSHEAHGLCTSGDGPIAW